MDLRIEHVNKEEVLNYLHYAGGEIPEDIKAMLDRAIEEVKQSARPKYKYLERDKDSEGLQEILLGKDIKSLLETSDRLILLAVTLGREVEMLIRRYTFSDLAYSVILDAVASSAVETLAEDINKDMEEKYKPSYLTDRFSPGYGDLPIRVQGQFLKLLEADKALGITTTESGIMIPRKSITAIIGISPMPQQRKGRACESCSLYADCRYRKRGELCGKTK